MKQIFGILLLVFLAGCQTDQPTASGSPEITIQGARADQIKPQLVNALLNKGLRLRTDSAYQLVLERKWGNAAGAAVLGALLTADASDVIERLTFSIADVGTGTRIVADRYMVKYPGTGRESANPANNAPGLDDLQVMLDGIAPTLVAAPPPPIAAPITRPKRGA